MSDPFARHGISHLSVSSLDLWVNEPALWVARYMYGIRSESGPSAKRGNAVEAGLNHALAGASDDEAIEAALANYALNVVGEITDDIEAERANIPGMVRLAAQDLRPLGRPLTTQRRIEWRMDKVSVPILGFIDYEFDEFILDLKSTLRLPSEPRKGHVVQVVSYGDALSKRPALFYVTPKKRQRFNHEQMDADGARWTLRRAAISLQVMLAVAADREEMANFMVPKFDDFRWDDPAKKAALEIWR